MAVLYYLQNRIRRSFVGGLVIALVIGVLCWFACVYDNFQKAKLQEIEAAYDSIPVTIVVSNTEGTQTDGLVIPEYLINYFISERYIYGGEEQVVAFSSYLSDVLLKTTLYYGLQNPSVSSEPAAADLSPDQRLVGLTAPETTRALDLINGIMISWFDDFEASLLRTEEPFCLVSRERLRSMTPEEDGQYRLHLAVQAEPEGARAVSLMLTVAGCYSGGGQTIFCPWMVVAQAQHKLGGRTVANNYYPGTVTADSMSATIRDNRQLEAFRELLARHFAEVDPSGRHQTITNSPVLTHHPFAVTVHDETLRDVITELSRNRQTLERLFPLLAALEMAIAFIVCFLYIQNRKRELSTARSLGTRRTGILSMVGLEMGVWMLLGSVLSGFTSHLLPSCVPPYGVVAGILASALLGAILSGFIYSGRNGIRSIKEDD